jgi:hypothetical protein
LLRCARNDGESIRVGKCGHVIAGLLAALAAAGLGRPCYGFDISFHVAEAVIASPDQSCHCEERIRATKQSSAAVLAFWIASLCSQ